MLSSSKKIVFTKFRASFEIFYKKLKCIGIMSPRFNTSGFVCSVARVGRLWYNNYKVKPNKVINTDVSERSTHPSLAQIEALIEFLERNPDLAKGFSKTQNARKRNRQHWQDLAVRLNSLGGAIKTYKQWTKYWSDKKSAIKKKVAAQAAARRRTGGGLEEVPELSEVEERIVCLFGGASFGTGDKHLEIQLFPENVSSGSGTIPLSPEIEIQHAGYLSTPNISHQSSVADESTNRIALTSGQRRQTVRRLFDDSEDVFATEPSQSILHDFRQGPSPRSPPPLTLSETPSPLPMPIASPSRRGTTAANIGRVGRTSGAIGSSSSCRAQPPTPPRRPASASPAVVAAAAPEASPSRRGATLTNTSRSLRTSQSASSSLRGSSRQQIPQPPLPPPPPPSQRVTEFSRITDRFLRIEEQHVEIRQSNARILQAMVDQNSERDKILGEAMGRDPQRIGGGLRALAEAMRSNNAT